MKIYFFSEISEDETDFEEDDDNKPQLIVIEPLENDEFHEISTDYLCLKDYDKQARTNIFHFSATLHME